VAVGLMVLMILFGGISKLMSKGSKAEVSMPGAIEAPHGGIAGELTAGTAVPGAEPQARIPEPLPMDENRIVADRVREIAKLEPAITAQVLRAWMETR